jgi:hypothetical protein
MTKSSLDVDRVTGQVSPSGATGTLAAGALLLTSALLTFLVGVFALVADDFVVSGPGYEYTFQITGWEWANILTGVVLAAVAVARFLSAFWARAAAVDVVAIWGVATWNT